ncbi:NUDIX hydrolase [Microbacterium oleivorans]|uniref:NUDIX hydrolase n=1 Tax=Microbacterium oleivorans TaxID=273677 RepID=UPI000767A08F|nr:NUDIX hydrolase [Microbacterium oleivorans]AZS42478.1 RNA pyrophosphohydrolase [Microbacterium oleivorans]THE08529.1 NUDIX domain-containing protein [Microbacterium oleivorans]
MDIRVAAYAVITDGDRILLAHWNSPTRPAWTMPGGGLDPGEDPMDAAVREVLEETGFHVELDGILGTDSQVIAAKDRIHGVGPIQALRIIYRAHVVGGELRNEEEGSTDEAAWFRIDEVASLTRVGLVDTSMRMAGLATA